MKTLLIVEDHHALAVATSAAAERSGLKPLMAPSLATARERLNEEQVDGILLDLGLPDGNGLDLIRHWQWSRKPEIAVITAHGAIDNAIDARKLGIARFLDKPVDFEALQSFFDTVAAASDPATASLHPEHGFAAFIGASAAMRPVFRQIAHACASDQSVVIRGATGTGKSQVTHLIRQAADQDQPTQLLHASSRLSDTQLAEAFHQSLGGQLIIETVESLPQDLQSRLVQLLDQAKEKAPRLIVTTGEDGLLPMVAQKRFQQDLYYRLQILEISLPPLKERTDDLPALADCFLGELNASSQTRIDDPVLEVFTNYDWPGNLRELRNTINFALVTSAGAAFITTDHIPDHLVGLPSHHGKDDALRLALEPWIDRQLENSSDYKTLSSGLEDILLRSLLRRYNGKPSHLASALGINRTTLRSKLRRIEE